MRNLKLWLHEQVRQKCKAMPPLSP